MPMASCNESGSTSSNGVMAAPSAGQVAGDGARGLGSRSVAIQRRRSSGCAAGFAGSSPRAEFTLRAGTRQVGPCLKSY